MPTLHQAKQDREKIQRSHLLAWLSCIVMLCPPFHHPLPTFCTNLPYICCQLGQAQTAVSIQGSERSAVTPDLSVIHSDAVTRQIQRGLTKVMYVKFVANYWHDGSIDDPLQLSGCLYQSLSYTFSCCSAPSPSDCPHQAQGYFIVPEKLRVQSTGKQSVNICCEPEEHWKSSEEV